MVEWGGEVESTHMDRVILAAKPKGRIWPRSAIGILGMRRDRKSRMCVDVL